MSGAKKEITILSRNLYLGSDLEPVAQAALSGNPADVANAATEFWAQVKSSNFPLRAEAFASEINKIKPDLIGLQEVSLFRTAPSATEEANDVEFDYLEILLDALARKGLNYSIASTHQAFDGQLPAYINPSELGSVRLTDRDVILVRSDLPARTLTIGKARSAAYKSQLELIKGLDVTRGWTSVDLKYNGKPLRFINSHLETSAAPSIQKQQARELIGGPAKSIKPTILVGDFNSDANNISSSAYGTYDLLTGKKLIDGWVELRTSTGRKKSATFGINDDLRGRPFGADPQRLDLILSSEGLKPLSISRFISPVETDSSMGPLWNSDHAGIAADFAIA